jgi:subtilisin family serine protease
VASAGNGSTCGGPTELVYPSAYDVVFSVSSVDHNDSHDNPNGSTPHQYNSTVDLTAPGYDVPLTAAPGWSLFGSGTSYASPIVAGTAGLIMSAYPGITPTEVKYILQSTAVNIDAQNPNYIGMLGAGRLMAGEAVKTALSYYYLSQNSNPVTPINDPILDPVLDVLSDGNNGHGNDDGGFDPSNPGQGNGNNGNNGNGRPNVNGNNTTNHKSVNIVDGVYDMTGRKVNLEQSHSGMYLVIRNGEVINKIWK